MAANDRLSASLNRAAAIADRIKVERSRTHFTTESAQSANAKKYAGVAKKPPTATVRVEADIIDLVKAWPTSERVHHISEAIREALKALDREDSQLT